MIKSQRAPLLDRCTTRELLTYFQNSWELEDLLFQSIRHDSTFYLNPDPLRNPLIFYLGHSAVFYINKLLQVGLLNKGINSYYETIFEIGVDPANPQEMQTILLQKEWPPLEKVWEYRHTAYHLLTNFVKITPLDLPIHPQHPLWAFLMATEHQRIHFETSSMLVRQLPSEYLQRPHNWQYAPTFGEVEDMELVEVKGEIVSFGKPDNDPHFGWDSEYGYRQTEVATFAASKYMITNGEFKKFIAIGGYKNPEYWDAQAWEWQEENGVTHPKFWLPEGDSYRYRAVFDELELPLDWPVEVNYYEALAYCRWQGGYLMNEAQWHLAAALNREAVEEYNLNLKFGSPTPVGYLKEAQSSKGLWDLRGNVWEWLREKFYPLPGFQPHYLYPDNATPFFDEQHKMMLGGAWITTGTGILGYYRNWFRPYFYQHAGFRLAVAL